MDKGLDYIKKHKHELIKKFASEDFYATKETPATIFMAGSPGAGKTEFSKKLIKILGRPIVRIDADEIRELIPGYTGTNSADFQSACIKGVEVLYDHVLKKKQDVIVDGTLASYGVACKNIERAISKNRRVAIFYIYQEPEDAWRFTIARESKEGRCITKDVFIDAFFKSKENVKKIKKSFGKNITIFVVEKNFNHGIENFWINVDNIDKYLKNKYTYQMIKSMLQ